MKKLRIVYMGTSEFAVPALKALAQVADVDIPLVVTQPDRERGRGGKVLPTPVKVAALEFGIRTLEPARIKANAEFFEALRAFAPDLIAVASYGQILPKEILELPPLGCVNIHASLLPKYRGAAPIARAIENGESETGITLMEMGEGLDDGAIIAQKATPIGLLNAGELTEKLAKIGAELLMEYLPQIADGTAPRTLQDESLATYAQKIGKEDAHIDFKKSAAQVLCQIRAMNPKPGAFALQRSEKIKLLRARIAEQTESSILSTEVPAGTVAAVNNSGIFARTADGYIVIEEICMPNKKPMRVCDYLRGNAFNPKSFE